MVDGAANEQRLGLDALAATIALLLWFAFGSFVLATVSGLGDHPVRRLSTGIFLVAAYAIALAQRRRLATALRMWPSVVLVIAAVELAAAVLDGAVESAYTAFSLTSIGLAAVVARTRTVWLCVCLLAFGYGAAALAARSPAALARDGDLGVVIGLMITCPVAAILLLALRWLLMRFVAGADTLVASWRQGVPALTPGLTHAIAGPRTLLLPRPPAPSAGLTPAEVRIVEGLSRGRAPKQLALDHDVLLSTVRTHIRNAKRKTGARTLRELAGLVAHPEWPNIDVLR